MNLLDDKPQVLDLAYLRQKLTPAVFDALMHDWAHALREAEREAETRSGDGNARLSWEQEVKGGHVTKTMWNPPPVHYLRRRNGSGG